MAYQLQAETAMRVQVKRWGNSASIRIPASVMAAAALQIDQPVDVREENGRVVIEPIRSPAPTLDELLARMSPDTFPEEVDFGEPVGGEVW
jgi:antitoxin MazE